MSIALFLLSLLILSFYAVVIIFLVRLIRAHPAVLADIAPCASGWLPGIGWFRRDGISRPE